MVPMIIKRISNIYKRTRLNLLQSKLGRIPLSHQKTTTAEQEIKRSLFSDKRFIQMEDEKKVWTQRRGMVETVF